jgi:lipoate-protein ligase A
VTVRSGSASALHAVEPPTDGRRHLWVLEPDRPALVLGSTQSDLLADADRLAQQGIELGRRRSGGGAVLLVPDRILWVDAFVPRGDPLWLDDVTASFAWLGRVWRAALAASGVEGTVHEGPLQRRAWGRLVCFAGVGAGEVLVGGRKVVGLSQRRTRDVARFQCVVELGHPERTLAEVTAGLLVEPADPVSRAELVGVLRASTAAVDASRDDVLDALLTALATV